MKRGEDLGGDALAILERRQIKKPLIEGLYTGGRARTYDLRFWRPLLCQLSYTSLSPRWSDDETIYRQIDALSIALSRGADQEALIRGGGDQQLLIKQATLCGGCPSRAFHVSYLSHSILQRGRDVTFDAAQHIFCACRFSALFP